MTKKTYWTTSKIEALSILTGTTERRVNIDGTLYLRLRARPSHGGISKVWEYRAQVHGKRKSLVIGDYSKNQSLSWARTRLAELVEREDRARKGEEDHPALTERFKRDKRKSDPTVCELFGEWIADRRLHKVRERTITLHTENYLSDIKERIGNSKVVMLDREALRACIDGPKKRGALGQANQVYKTLRALINFAISEGILTSDLMVTIKNPKPYNPRQGGANAAGDRELVALFQGLDSKSSHIFRPVRQAIKFQLLTGARPTEAREVRWSEIDEGSTHMELASKSCEDRSSF